MWGTSPVEQFWQNFGGGPKQENLYTELQTGVMPTQVRGALMSDKSESHHFLLLYIPRHTPGRIHRLKLEAPALVSTKC